MYLYKNIIQKYIYLINSLSVIFSIEKRNLQYAMEKQGGFVITDQFETSDFIQL